MKLSLVFLPFLAFIALVACKSPTLSTSTEIISFHQDVEGDLSSPDTEGGNHYTLTVPFGTDLAKLDLDLQPSPGATISPDGSQDFTSGPVEFTVTTEDGTTKIYAITVTKREARTGKEIVGFHPDVDGNLSSPDTEGGNHYTLKAHFLLDGNWDWDLAKLDLDLQPSPGATISPDGSQDFTSGPVEFTVTAEDGTTKIYAITVEKMPTPFLVKREGNQWIIAEPQNRGSHTAIWKIEDLLRVGSKETNEAFGGNIWKLSGNYVLMGDLDFTQESDYRDAMDKTLNADGDNNTVGGIMAELNPNETQDNLGWKPIGVERAPFRGSFEGNKKTISHLYINRPNENSVGLWGYTSQATLSNLGVLDVDIHGADEVGGLVGSIDHNSTIQDLYSTGEVRGGNNVGGLVGSIGSDSTIKRTYAAASVHGRENVGGLVGGPHAFTGNYLFDNIAMGNEITTDDTLTSPQVARVYGNSLIDGLFFSHNYANRSMEINGSRISNSSHSSRQGKDTDARKFAELSFYRDQKNFDSIWDFINVWEIKQNAERPTFIGSSDPALGRRTEIISIRPNVDGDLSSPDTEGDNQYALTVPFGTDLADLDLDLQPSPGATISPDGPQNFTSGPVDFTVTAGDGTTKIYRITVTKREVRTGKEIVSIRPNVDGDLLSPDTEGGNHYTLTVPFGTDLAKLDLDLQPSPGATISPDGPQDFTSDPVEFTVTAEDGTTKIYRITVTNEEARTGKEIVGFHPDVEGDLSSPDTEGGNHYTLKAHFLLDGNWDWDLAKLDLDLQASPGATISPDGSQDFTSGPVEFTVTAEDGTTKIYAITVEKMPRPFLVKKEGDQWVGSDRQGTGIHTAIWKIEDLLRVGSKETNEAFGGDIWKLSDNYVLMGDLDFTQESDYRDAMDKTLNADGDNNTVGGIMAELNPNETQDNLGWKPIGVDGAPFRGSFEGNGKTIKNLYINRGSTSFIGLFGESSAATIQDLGLLNVQVTGNWHVGGLLGWSPERPGLTISRSYSTGTVTGGEYTGGLVGSGPYSLTINDSYSTAMVTGGEYTGGLVGGAGSGSHINTSYSTGTVTGIGNTGGLIGELNNSTINHSFTFNDKITGSGRIVGSVILPPSGKIEDYLRNNYGFTDTLVNGDFSLQNGEDMTASDLTDPLFYSASLSDWNFTTVWELRPGALRPTLQGSQEGDQGTLLRSVVTP